MSGELDECKGQNSVATGYWESTIDDWSHVPNMTYELLGNQGRYKKSRESKTCRKYNKSIHEA